MAAGGCFCDTLGDFFQFFDSSVVTVWGKRIKCNGWWIYTVRALIFDVSHLMQQQNTHP